PVILRLRAAASIEITVLSADGGKPIAGADVALRDEPVGAAQTGPDGKATLRGVGRGWHLVEAQAAGYAPAASPLESTGSPKAVEKHTVLLKHGAAVSGRVVDPSGKPVAGARVLALDASALWSFTDRKDSVATGADGKFTLKALPAGTFR